MSSDVKSLFAVLKWKFTSTVTQWPANIVNKAQPNVAKELNEGEISTTFINHATHLIQVKGVNIITDPVFSERVSPFTWIGPKRVRRPGIELKDLPPIQVVLISHNHYDHMDAATIKDLAERFDPLFIVPLGNEHLVKDMGAKKIMELDWWQSAELPNKNTVTLVPAQHWSRRSMFDTNKALWGGYVVKAADQRQIYFAGDTGYGPHFKVIREKLGPMDVSIIPIGAYEPRWFMKDQHMNPEDSVQAHLDLESKFSLGTHFGTFQLTDEGIDEPVQALATALNKMKVNPDRFVAPDLGETTFMPALKKSVSQK
jgi:L-ascorbate metabolism protein UlaG (beta-lactamase superfamily)